MYRCQRLPEKALLESKSAPNTAVAGRITLRALSAPLAGWLTGHYGARKVILPATAVFGALLLSNKAFSGSLWHLYIFFAALGFVINGVGPIPYGNVVSHWFDRRRGLALGLMMVGIGVGAMVMPLFAQQLIARFGWQTAYAILGAAVLLISLPITGTFIKEKPQDLGLFPDGGTPGDPSSGSDAGVRGDSLRDAWHTRTFWVLVCAFFLVSGSVQGCFVHLTAMLTDRGTSAQTAVFGSSVAGAAVLTGRAFTGYLLDLIFAPRVAAVFFCVAALGIALLWLGTTSAAFAGGIFVGLGLGAEVDIIAYLTGRYFGLRAFGQIYGCAFAAFALAGALGPLIMGAGFDLTGSYRLPLVAFLAATLVAIVLISSLGPYHYCLSEPNEHDEAAN